MVTNDNQNSKFYTFQSFMLILSRTGQPLLKTSCFYGCIGLSETDMLYDRTGQSETLAFLAGLVNFGPNKPFAFIRTYDLYFSETSKFGEFTQHIYITKTQINQIIIKRSIGHL